MRERSYPSLILDDPLHFHWYPRRTLDLPMPSSRRLTKSRNKVFFGVCSGLAEFLDWPARTVRSVWGLATLFTGGAAILAYIVLAFAMPPPRTFNLDDYREQ